MKLNDPTAGSDEKVATKEMGHANKKDLNI